jgi:AAA+ superfamily predicted ATPase
MNNSTTELFERGISYPDFEYQERLNSLVGLDDHKQRLIKTLSLLANPTGLNNWGKRHHPNAKSIIDRMLRRPPLIVLAGDVGSGKTELAMTIGDAVARQEDISITLLPLSLSTRGQGRVGEMTQLISAAFDHTISEAEKLKKTGGGARGAIILMIDEADALAQSRESGQMHHEDKAGVNAFIRGIDRIANGKLPAVVLMCTNRLNALDPAIKRRAAEILSFARPDSKQRGEVLTTPLSELGFTKDEIAKIVDETGEKKGRDYGFTFSDLTQRLIPSIVLDAYPNNSVSFKAALKVAQSIVPTPPFKDL